MLKIYRATQTLDAYNRDMLYTTDKSQAEIIIVGGKPIVLDEYPLLKGIFKTGVGTDNLPFEEAEKRNIRIKLPSEQTKNIIYDETASFACFLIMQGLYINAGFFDTWTKNNRNAIGSLRLLVMGTGKIGARVIERMKRFMHVDSYDPLQNNQDELNAMLNVADVVSLHMPLTPSTRNFFDKEKLMLLKDNALLVNTSRGPIVNEEDLYAELSSNRLRAAFDVFWDEPYKGKLLGLSEDRFIRTPHVASTCEQFLTGLASDLVSFCEELESK